MPVAAFADEIGDVVAPTGIMALVVIIPLIVVLVLLFMKVDMIIAGFNWWRLSDADWWYWTRRSE